MSGVLYFLFMESDPSWMSILGVFVGVVLFCALVYAANWVSEWWGWDK